jgi:GntR family transcriptional regulator
MSDSEKFIKQPLYLQVRDLVAQRITDGHWSAGAALPNEIELARELGVSSGTMRKALDALESERLVVRRQGRGTFVVDQASQELSLRFSNIRDEQCRKLAIAVELVEQTQGPATEDEQARLGLSPTATVLRSRRLRHDQGQCCIVETAHLALTRFSGLVVAEPLDYRISALAQRHGLQLARASEHVTAGLASSEVAAHLGIAKGAPILQLDRLIFSKEGQALEWRIGLCHLGESRKYCTEMN